jgi:hypothetical protein
MAVSKSRRLYPGGAAALKRRGWRTCFSESERSELQQILGKKYNSKLVDDLESEARAVFEFAAEARVTTLSEQRDRAKVAQSAIEKLSEVLNGSSPGINPTESFENFLRAKLDDENYSRLQSILRAFYNLTSQYLGQFGALPRRKQGDIKWYFSLCMAIVLNGSGINLARGRGTTFYRILSVAFNLLGEDCVADPYIYTSVEASFPAQGAQDPCRSSE